MQQQKAVNKKQVNYWSITLMLLQCHAVWAADQDRTWRTCVWSFTS